MQELRGDCCSQAEAREDNHWQETLDFSQLRAENAAQSGN